MKKLANSLACLLISCLPTLLFAQAIDIAAARQTPLGAVVTVRGIVTSGAELGRIRYLQDATAGIGAFPGTGSQAGFEANVTTGDMVEITGKLVDFNGLLEISPVTAYQVLSSGNALPAPKPTTLATLSENLEGQLVSLECISFPGAGGVFSSGSAYPIADPDGGQSSIYLRNTSPLLGVSIPSGTIRLTAILSQFNDFQLLPRTAADFEQQPCFHIVQAPEQSDIRTDGFSVAWTTNLAAFSVLRYGTAPDALIYESQSPSSGTEHAVALSGLQPGTVYWVQAVASHNGEMAFSDTIPFTTQSLSTGEIKVFFNHAVLPGGPQPNGQSFNEVLAETLARINAAQVTIDVAMYNNNRTDIVAALSAAHQRGVLVRYVAAEGATSPALAGAQGFEYVFGNDINLMHNKFMVVDADLPKDCWVMSGSLNWTTSNMEDDYNNTLFIQDQSLAWAYTLEFNEMWGSPHQAADPAKARFGAAKKDNTPHRFIIGSIPIEAYFSPSDQTSSRIEKVIRAADDDLFFALLTFTKNELGQAVADRHAAGVTCRGIIDNWNDNGSEYQFLLDNGVAVIGDPKPEVVHHKYGVADATLPSSDPTVSTGSHNWSQTADSGNDENTLIIHDAAIARLYKQEFDRRWSEVSVSTQTPENQTFEAFPNPASTTLALLSNSKVSGKTHVEIFDAAGQRCLVQQFAAGQSLLVQVQPLAAGSYFAKITLENGRVATIPFQKVPR